MSNIDDLIRERLNKLRSEAQIPSSKPSSSLPPPNKKSSVEEVEFLLQQLSAQTELEEKSMNERLDIDSQILQRLEKLKAESGSLIGGASRSATAMSRSAAARPEPEDDVTPPPERTVNEFMSEDSDEGDTCVMCDAAPSVSCHGCFNDLYCQRCFKECHDAGENHQAKPFIVGRKK